MPLSRAIPGHVRLAGGRQVQLEMDICPHAILELGPLGKPSGLRRLQAPVQGPCACVRVYACARALSDFPGAGRVTVLIP